MSAQRVYTEVAEVCCRKFSTGLVVNCPTIKFQPGGCRDFDKTNLNFNLLWDTTSISLKTIVDLMFCPLSHIIFRFFV